MALGIDTAMQLSSTTNTAAAAGGGGRGGRGGAGRSRRQHVQNLVLVRAKPIYGFYPEDKIFIKIIL
jgi:ribosomal protein L15